MLKIRTTASHSRGVTTYRTRTRFPAELARMGGAMLPAAETCVTAVLYEVEEPEPGDAFGATRTKHRCMVLTGEPGSDSVSALEEFDTRHEAAAFAMERLDPVQGEVRRDGVVLRRAHEPRH